MPIDDKEEGVAQTNDDAMFMEEDVNIPMEATEGMAVHLSQGLYTQRERDDWKRFRDSVAQ